MTNSMTFPAQIASVMEVLANAAVAQICKLVDDDYAVFRLEMTQSQRENRVLRRKVQTLELKMARERAERTMRERVLANRVGSNVTAGVKILDKFRGAASRGEGFLPGRHRSFGTPGDDAEGEEGAWRPDDPSVAPSEGPDSSTQGVITVTILGECSGGKPGGSVSSQLKQERSPPPAPPPPARPGPDRQSEEPEDTGAEVCLVKEERKEGEEEEEGGASCDLDSALITGGELSGAATPGDWTMEPSPRTWPPRVPQEPLLLHHEPDPSPGSEPDHQGAGFSLSDHAHWTGGPSLGGLGPASMVPHIWTQRRPVADSGAGVGSGSGIGSAPGARPDLGSGSGSGVGPGPGARPDLGSVPRPSMNHPPPPHSYLPTLHGLRTHPQHQRSPAAYNTLLYPHNTLAAGSKTHHSSGAGVAAVGPSGGGGGGGGGGAPRPLQPGRPDLRGKADSERPYSCPTCGKRFTEASYVKKHQTVHTREKPFRCKQCWKSFSFLSNLIRHRGVHRVNKDQGGAVEWTM